MIITISGNIASGKSTVGDALAKMIKFKRYSSGNFMRKMAKKKGISLQELGRQAEKDINIDREIDEWIISISKKHDNFIIDSRLAWYFIPNSFKVYLHAGSGEQLRRIKLDLAKKKRGDEEIKVNEETKDSEKIKKQKNSSNLEKEILKKVKQRDKSERDRYEKYYGINFHDKKFYDLWLDTNNMTIDDCAVEIRKVLKKKKLI